MPPKRDNNTSDLSTICDLDPPEVRVSFVPRVRKEIQDIAKIDIIDQLDDIVDIALSNEKPQCSAAVAAVALKAKMLGMLDADSINNADGGMVKVEIVGVKSSNSNS